MRETLVVLQDLQFTGTTLVWENGVRRVMRVAVVVMLVVLVAVVVGSD